MAEEPARQKDDLVHLISEAEKEASKVQRIGNEIVETAQFIRDTAKPLSEIVKERPPGQLPPGELARQIEGWRGWHENAQQVLRMTTNVNSFVAISEGVTNTSVSGVMTAFVGQPIPTTWPQSIAVPRLRLFQALDRYPLIDRAGASMLRMRLDSRGGSSRPPLDLLHEARGALDRPVVGEGGPVSVLISLRECIDAVITELVRRGPNQEPTKGWTGKIVSVGAHCGHRSLSAGHFDLVPLVVRLRHRL
jgi:hypothetical protein